MKTFVAALSVLLLTSLYSCQALSFSLQGNSWPEPEALFLVKIIHNDSGGTSPSGESWNDAFETAMALWQQDTPFEFDIVKNSFAPPCLNGTAGDGKNGVDFRADTCGAVLGETTLATTITTISISNPTITLESDIIFNESKDWDVYNGSQRGSTFDFVRIAVHELGHVIGLGHENSVQSIMNSFASNIEVPQQDDINGVIALYGSVDGDSDNDGIPDSLDNCPEDSNASQANNDGDSEGNICDDDDDNDGMSDSFELLHNLNPLQSSDAQKDPDGDGFTNLEEFKGFSDPRDRDSVPGLVGLPFLVPLLLDD